MINDDLLDQLRHKGEGPDLDFKQAQYPFSSASDHQKAELLKDILAMANAYRDAPGYILIGFRDRTPHPAELIGISATDHIDDATLQQFVNSKVDPQLQFGYEERMFDGQHIAVITVPKQSRPFALTKDFGHLKKGVVYVRRGSSTGEASMSEVSKMVLTDAGVAKSPQVVLHLENENNNLLPHSFELEFLEFADLPDYEESYDFHHVGRLVNSDFYREGAEYHSSLRRLIQVRLSLSNNSSFSLGEVKLELRCAPADGQRVQMMRSDYLPDAPEPSSMSWVRGVHSVIEQMRERVQVDDRGREPVCHIALGTLRPGETGQAEIDVALLPSGAGDYVLRVKIFAKEIATPIVKEHALTVSGPVIEMAHADLLRLLYKKLLGPTHG